MRPPVEMLKLAQAGLFCTENDKLLPSTSLAVGVNKYAEPAATEVSGDPEITGAELAGGAAAASLPPPPQPARPAASSNGSVAAARAHNELFRSRTG